MLEEHIANLKDLQFIYSCIIFGARKGHYTFDVNNPAIIRCMKHEIQSVINQQKLLDERQAQASIYSVNNERIAVVIICEASPGASCYEIYAMSVLKHYQNRGYGGQILNTVLNRFLYLDICARCLPASDKMSKLLERSGFKFHSMDKECKVMLRTAVEDYSLTQQHYRMH